jgi:hypothetical protein
VATTICVIMNTPDEERLEAIVGDCNRLQKPVERARVALASARGDVVQRVATQIDVSRPMVWR